jgi:type II secretory pathway pseudopilin PulG
MLFGRRRAGTLRKSPRRSERGFLLLGIVTTIVVGSILSGMAIQEWSVIERRDREQQLLFVQEQYAAAILRYQQANGALPTELDQLDEVNTETGAYIRKLYSDPMNPGSKPEDWCLLQLGPSGRVVSSCASARQQGEMGLGSGSDFQLGGSSRLGRTDPRRQQRQGLPGGGGKGIAGVHSKSTEKAYNIVERDETTYDKWWYTYEDYRKDSTAVAIPGLPQGQGPGLGNQPGNNRRNPGTRGGRGRTGGGRTGGRMQRR